MITLTLAAAAFMGVFAMFTVVQSEIDKLFETFNYEIVIVPTEAQDFETGPESDCQTEGIDEVLPGVGFDIRILDVTSTPIAVGEQDSKSLRRWASIPLPTYST